MSPHTLPRSSLAATCFGHAAVLGWAASALPWRSGTLFALILSLLAVLHVATAVIALLRKPAWLLQVWRALSIASALAFVVIGWSMLAAALYVTKLYTRLGPSVAGGIIAALVILGLLTVPIAIWGALYTWSARSKSLRRLGVGGGSIVTLFVFTLPLASSAAVAEPVAMADSRLSSELSNQLEEHLKQPQQGARRTVAGAGPATCKEPVTSLRLTLFVAFASKKGSPEAVCLQADSPRNLRTKLERTLTKARPGSTVVIDLVRGIKPLWRKFPLLDVLDVRPGIDGVCDAQRCLPAWQLTLGDAFSENHPLPSIPEVSYGLSIQAVRKALRSPETSDSIDGFVRLETESFSADSTGVHRLIRTRTTPPAVSADGVAQAVQAAQRYIVDAQEEDGTFRYALDPTTGVEDKATLNLPRQAGTTYALCELGSPDQVHDTVQRALSAFAPTETKFGEISALADASEFGLGKSALPLLAMLRCRALAGSDNDRLAS
jgi:hypothetical protein